MEKVLALNLRRPVVYCIRDFPPGCGPGAAVEAQRKEEKAPCPAPTQPLHPPSSDRVGQPVDSGEDQSMAVDVTKVPPCPVPVHPLPFAAVAPAEVCQGVNSCEENRMADGDVDCSGSTMIVMPPEEKEEAYVALAAEVDEKTSRFMATETPMGPVEVNEKDVKESSGTLECSRPSLIEVKEDKETQRITGSCEEAAKLKSLELIENISISNEKNAETVEPAESMYRMEADGVRKNKCYSKLYPPPRRRNISAIRDYPTGCGRNAAPMSREECLKLVEEAASNRGIHIPREKNPSPPENVTEDKVPSNLDMVEMELKCVAEATLSKNQNSKGEKKTMMHEKEASVQALDRAEVTSDVVEGTGALKPTSEIFVSKVEGLGEQLAPAKALDKVPSNPFLEETKKRTEPRQNKQVQLIEECPVDHEDPYMVPLRKRKSFETEKKHTLMQVQESKRHDKTFPESKLMEDVVDVANKNSQIKGMHRKDGVKKMIFGQVYKAKTDVPVVHQAVKVSQFEKAQSSKSPSPIVGFHYRSDPIHMKKKISPSSTSQKLQNSKVKDIHPIKRKFTDKVNNEKINNDNSKAFGNKVIVQALMAAPNCPWMHGRKSGASGSCPAVGKTKVKIEKFSPCKKLALLEFEEHDHEENERADTAKHGENGSALVLYEGSTDWNVNINPIVPSGSTARKVKAVKKGKAPLSKQLDLTEIEGIEDSLVKHEETECGHGALTLFEGSNEWSVNITPIVPSYSCSGREDVAARQKVRNSLRLFQAVCRKVLHCQEAQKNDSEKIKRIDLTACNILKRQGQWPTTGEPIFGDVPGVEVGDEFQFRVELAMVGLHRPYQGGIDFAKKGNMYVALSVVASGGYHDDMDSSDVLIYSGSGGNPGGTNKNKIPEDQKLQRGNLALKNSIDTKTPVRVIHGFKEGKPSSSHDSKMKLISTFTYAGLYHVEEYWQEKGSHGFKVFKFKLRKIPGQPELALQIVKRTKKLKVREGLCIKDISGGKERIPICVINTIDDDRPMSFNYITKIKYPSWYINTPPKGCDCKDGCSDSEKCACARKNGGEIPYNFNGAIVQAKKLVFECGPSCMCPSSCHNRVTQHGIKIPLEIFKTGKRGWGVRSLYSIPSGSFICEYIGELLQDEEAERRSNDEYLFDIGHNYDDPSLWKDLPDHMLDPQASSSPVTLDSGYTIDAAEQGNVGRFINHSCSPNLYAQDVLYDHDDRRMPHVMLFAADNIPPLQELTYHYNYKIDGFHDSEGNIKKKDCYCGSAECCGRLY